MSKRY